jgi:hypothetical protein
VCDNLNLSLANLGDLDYIAEVSNTSVNLDLILEEFLEGGDVEDFVGGGLRGVDDELIPLAPNSNLFTILLKAGPRRRWWKYLVRNLGLLALGRFL